MNFFSVLALFLLTSCSQSHITIYTDYLSHENLASYHVDTPDPLLNNPPIGQRLILTWSVPKYYLEYEDLHIDLIIRLRNQEQIRQTLPISGKRGTFIFSLMNDEYMAKRGILTYKAILWAIGEVLEEWYHQLWTDLIFINHESTSQPTTESNLYEDFE